MSKEITANDIVSPEMLEKIRSIGKGIGESIATTDRLINEARPILRELGYDINPNTGEIFTLTN